MLLNLRLSTRLLPRSEYVVSFVNWVEWLPFARQLKLLRTIDIYFSSAGFSNPEPPKGWHKPPRTGS
eukprot:2597855-Amphidinium_carterae.1